MTPIVKEYTAAELEGIEILGARENILKDHLVDLTSKNETATAQKTLSASESLTGETWIDGKPIYRKTLDITWAGTVGIQTSAHGVTGIGSIIGSSGFFSYQSAAKTRPLPCVPTDGTVVDQLGLHEWDTTDLHFNIGSSYVTTDVVDRIVITIEYTKA